MEDHFDFCHLDGPLCPSMPKFAQKSFEEYLSSNDPRLKKFKKRISLEAGALESFFILSLSYYKEIWSAILFKGANGSFPYSPFWESMNLIFLRKEGGGGGEMSKGGW